MSNTGSIGRIVATAAVIVGVIAVVAILLGTGGDTYTIHARFQNASQLVKGNLVQVSGRPVGSVKTIDLTDDGQANVTMEITDDAYFPLRQGTKAVVRQASLSGVANRYVDLQLPPATATATIKPGGTIYQADTTTAVDLDELFNTFDPKTRDALRGVIRGYATAYGGRGAATNEGWQYLNPSLAATSRLFRELNYDTPMLRRFIVSSSNLVTDIAERKTDLAGLIDNLARTTEALGRQKGALASAIAQLPPFMRRANSTFVNLRAALKDLTPLIDESKPVAKRLRPFLAELRPLAHDARPTLRQLTRLISSPGAGNDLIDLTNSTVPVAKQAIGPVTANGKSREGAFPASTKALKEGTPELAYARPYAVDLTGWFDDFSHSGVFDALGAASRAAPYVNVVGVANSLIPLAPDQRATVFNSVASLDQRNRCPGAAERQPWTDPAPNYPCDPKQIPPGS